jgi:predicted Na+-dependent transporter
VQLFRGLSASLILLAAMTIGLGAGFLAPAAVDPNAILWPAIFAQTVVAVGGLKPDWITDPTRRIDAMRLLLVHHAVATVPYIAIWLLLPDDLRHSGIAVGLLWLALVPTAGGLPAYATAARVSPNILTAFALLAYASGLLITPLLALALFGGGADIGRLMVSMLVGLIAPASLGILLGRWIRRLPGAVRTTVVAVSMIATTYVFGGSVQTALSAGALPLALCAIALLAGAARVPLSSALGYAATRRQPRVRAASLLACGYKNDALAATAAMQVAGPIAVLPALGSLLAEMALMIVATLLRRGDAGLAVPSRDGLQPEY